MTAKLLLIEGPDGSGKTTACNFIREAMTELNQPFEVVNILSGHPTSLALRKVLTDAKSEFDPKAEMLAYAATITNTMRLKVLPLLLSGVNVLIDRGPFSTFAYQVQMLDSELFDLWARVNDGFRANATFMLRIDPQSGLQRCANRDGKLDRLESKPIEYHTQVVRAYETICQVIETAPKEKNSVFLKMAGAIHTYANTGSYDDLQKACMNFVHNTFAFADECVVKQ